MKQMICDACGNVIQYEEHSTEENQDFEDQSVNGILTEILLNTQEQSVMIDSMIRNQINIKDAQIDKLHGELQYYKDDHASRFIDQVMKAVIKVRKGMLKRTNAKTWEEMTVADLKREYEYIIDDLTDLLEQQNIYPYETVAGEPFDAAIHQVFQLEYTDNTALDKKIKKSVSQGYIKNGRPMIVERVVVYQYKDQNKDKSK